MKILKKIIDKVNEQEKMNVAICILSFLLQYLDVIWALETSHLLGLSFSSK